MRPWSDGRSWAGVGWSIRGLLRCDRLRLVGGEEGRFGGSDDDSRTVERLSRPDALAYWTLLQKMVLPSRIWNRKLRDSQEKVYEDG